MNVRCCLSLLLLVLPVAYGIAKTEGTTVDFAAEIKPILRSRCIVCHHSGALFGNVNLENRALAFRNRPGGAAILPGRPDSSPLYQVLRRPTKDLKAMPPDGHRISEKEQDLLYQWILQGAVWPTGPAGVVPLDHIKRN